MHVAILLLKLALPTTIDILYTHPQYNAPTENEMYAWAVR